MDCDPAVLAEFGDTLAVPDIGFGERAAAPIVDRGANRLLPVSATGGGRKGCISIPRTEKQAEATRLRPVLVEISGISSRVTRIQKGLNKRSLVMFVL